MQTTINLNNNNIFYLIQKFTKGSSKYNIIGRAGLLNFNEMNGNSITDPLNIGLLGES